MISSCRDFVRTDRRTNRLYQKQYLLAVGAQVKMVFERKSTLQAVPILVACLYSSETGILNLKSRALCDF